MLKLMLMLCLSFALVACGPGEQGEPGPAGPPGQQGPAGPKGDPGSGLAAVLFCGGFVETTPDGLGWDVSHGVYTFKDGSVLATCLVDGGNAGSSNVFMYRASMAAAAVGWCTVTRDDESDGTAGLWRMEVTADRLTSRLTYADPGSALHNRTFSLPCTSY